MYRKCSAVAKILRTAGLGESDIASMVDTLNLGELFRACDSEKYNNNYLLFKSYGNFNHIYSALLMLRVTDSDTWA
jgi:hypothetical protein